MTDRQRQIDPRTGLFVNEYGTAWTPADEERTRLARAGRVDAAVAERQRAEADAAAANERRRREDGAARLDAYRRQSEIRWLDNGGSESGFGQAWPSLRDRWLAAQLGERERVVAAEREVLGRNPLYSV